MNKKFLMLLALVGAFQVSTAMADAPVAEKTAQTTIAGASDEVGSITELDELVGDLDPALDDEVQKLAGMSEEELSKTLTEMMQALEAEAGKDVPASAQAA